MKISLQCSIIICFLLVLPTMTNAQSPYEMNWKRDGALIVLGVPLAALGITLDRSIDAPTFEEVNQLDRMDVFRPDRFVTYNYSIKAAKWSDILLYSCIAAPVFLMFTKKVRDDYPVISGMYLQTLILGVALPAYGKGGVQRIRPYAYNPDVPIDSKMTSETKRSFFSGHTTMAFASMVFFSTVYSTYYTNSKAKSYIWTGSMLIASTVGYLRIAAGRHFLTDVLVGVIVGAAIGYTIPKIHETDNPEMEMMMSQESTRRPMISFQFWL